MTTATEDHSDFVRRVALTPHWRIMTRLLTVMPQVSRAQNERIPAGPGKNMATPGGYPARVFAPDDWADAIRLIPAQPVSENADWIILPDELPKAPDPIRALRALYGVLKPEGGYVILKHETSQVSTRDAEHEPQGVVAPWYWWRSKYHVAENPGRDAALCYEAMWELQVERDCVTLQEDIEALSDWSPRNVVILEVRPKRAVAVAHLPRQGFGAPVGVLPNGMPAGPVWPQPPYVQQGPKRPGLIKRFLKALEEF